MSNDARQNQIEALCDAALALPVERRLAFLKEACADDPSLVFAVEELLAERASRRGEATSSTTASELLLEQLEEQKPPRSRYRLIGEVARGGMGAILRVWDGALRRHLAMKVVLGSEEKGAKPDVDPRRMARFLEEAQITGQLDHPGIVPVHELGVDQGGRVFFTMRLVKGWDLDEVFEFVRKGKDGWTRTRALGVLLKVCEAMAYAHDRQVMHRDLKPKNIKVGRYGDVYVMDWGLGRVMDGEDAHDLRPSGDAPPVSEIQTYREADAMAASPLITRDGDVIGTPTYMSPEQARGERESMGFHTDVYAVGAMLYELLAGNEPYFVSGPRLSAHAIWRFVLEGPPQPIDEVAPDSPPELVAICEKAMAREIGERFTDMGELASELRAFLEGRVVASHRVGPIIELKKWVQRNRLAARTIGVAAAAVLFGLVVLWQGERAKAERLGLEADVLAAGRLLDEVDSLWPVSEERAQRYAVWQKELDELLARAADRNTVLAANQEPSEDETFLRATLQARRKTLLDSERSSIRDPKTVPGGGTLSRYRDIVRWEVARIDERLARPEAPRRRPSEPGRSGLESMLAEELSVLATFELPRVRERFEREIRRVESASAPIDWTVVNAAIEGTPAYAGLTVPPLDDLRPLGPDPVSGLWEFWAPATGEEPRRSSATGQYEILPETALVFVLVPGGEVRLGVDLDDPGRADYFDPADLPAELHDRPPAGYSFEPPRQVEVDAFLLSKYEMTQAQWLRLSGENPSAFDVGSQFGTEPAISPTHPVESVSWHRCREALEAWNMALPTEAQWIRAAGGVESEPWSADYADPPVTLVHVPVDSLAPGPFGFHGLRGNVREWCRDWWTFNYSDVEVEFTVMETGELKPRYANRKTLRGSSFRQRHPTDPFRFARFGSPPDSAQVDIGVRPMRTLP